MASNITASLLLVDDDRQILDSMAPWLREQGFAVEVASTVIDAIQHLNRQTFDVALVDIRLPDGDGFQILKHCQEKHPQTTVMLITGYGNVDVGVEALRNGAFDLLTKPLIDDELLMSLKRALAQRHVLQENKELKAELDHRYSVDNIIGSDHRMKKIFEMIDSVADTRATVLITGESGTGKSLIARAIHRRSSRRDSSFVEVACGALPETLLESELFGHVKGAFTGAHADKLGKFKQADAGTIFLDEIGTAPPSMQVKLLRVLQDMEFEAVGGNKTFHVDTRAVLATNEDLAMAVAQGRFRQDLFYRINVINIEIPPLRDRISDIPRLATHFLEQVNAESGKGVQGFSTEALAILQNYAWPGNVRELQNVISRTVLLGKSDTIQADDLPPNLSSRLPVATASCGGRTLKEALEGPERQIILEVLESNGWNRNATADALGINRTTLYKKMKRLGLEEMPRQAAMSAMGTIGGPPAPGAVPNPPMGPTPTF